MRGKEASWSQALGRAASFNALAMRSPLPSMSRFDPGALTQSMTEAGGLRSLPTQIRDRQGMGKPKGLGKVGSMNVYFFLHA
jgi:hypothetical protein